MSVNAFACQQFAVLSTRPASAASEGWQLVAGLEAAVILVLFVGWLHAAARPREYITKSSEEPP